MLALIITLPAAILAGLGWMTRSRHQSLPLTTWMGVLLIGAGAPVLVGQLVSLTMTGIVEQTGNGNYILYPLIAGLCGALGWAAGVIAARVSCSSAD